MSMHLRIKFDGKCVKHTRYNPAKDGAPTTEMGATCKGCDDLYVIWLYSKIIEKRVSANTSSLTIDNNRFILPRKDLEPEVLVTQIELAAATTAPKTEVVNGIQDKSGRGKNHDRGGGKKSPVSS